MCLLCLEYKCVSVDYYLDYMQFYELYPLLSNMGVSIKQDWERSRLVAFVVAQANSTKKLKPEDIVKFAWDKKDDPKAATNSSVVMTAELREKMLREAAAREKELKSKGII